MQYLFIFAVVFIFLFIFLKRNTKKNKFNGNQFSLTDLHFTNAKEAEKEGDYKKARREYKACVNISKKNETAERHIFFQSEYEQFVKRDPIFKKLIDVFTKGINENPDVKISRMYFDAKAKEWAERYNYGDTIPPEDISYVLEFGENLGYFDVEDMHEIRLQMEAHHLKQAREAEKNGDHIGARVSYSQYIEVLKQANEPEKLEKAKKEYAEFVKRDPIFIFFLDEIRQNPGILQSDITSKAVEMDWAELRNYNRTISKDDIRYVFYFAEEFGFLIRKKEGRSYRLYLPEQLVDL